jgi:hypothetical protein
MLAVLKFAPEGDTLLGLSVTVALGIVIYVLLSGITRPTFLHARYLELKRMMP